MKGPDQLAVIAENALAKARRAGAQAAEVFLSEKRNRQVVALGDFVEAKEGEDEGIGIRVLVDGHLGHSGMKGLTDENIDAVVQNALESVRGTQGAGGFKAFPSPSAQRPRGSPLDPAVADPDPDRLAGVLDELLSTLKKSPGITYYGAKVSSGHGRFLVANTNGLVAWNESAGAAAEVAARAGRGTQECTANATWAGARPPDEALDLEAFAEEAATNARSALNASPLGNRVDTVILAPPAAAQVIGPVAAAFSARRVQRGQSPLADRLGEGVACPGFSLRDAPHGPMGSRIMQIDHEGVPTQPLTLIDKGVLREFVYDTATATTQDRVSTGHGLRASLGGAVIPRIINAVIEGGDRSVAELIETADRAVLVTDELMGSISSNNTTGDFSLVAPYAFLVENGKVKHALPPTTIAGNAYKVLEQIESLSKEVQSIRGGTLPTIRSGGITCAT